MNAQFLTVLLSVLLALGAIVFNVTSGKQIERIIFGYFAVIFTSPTPSPSATPTSISQATPTSTSQATPTPEPTLTPNPTPTPTPTPSPSATPTPTSTFQATRTPEPTLIPTPSPSATPTQTPQIPLSNDCAVVSGGFYMPTPNTWYGPFDNRFSLMWDQQNIYTRDFQSPIYYPHANFTRGTWIKPSPYSPFNICIEPSSGKVFGQYNP